jgi:hypothetical protein
MSDPLPAGMRSQEQRLTAAGNAPGAVLSTGPMDITTDTQTPNIEWAPVARTMMEQLSTDEQADVRSSVDRVARGFGAVNVKQVQRRRQGQRPFFVVQATPTLRVLFERMDDHVRVLDVVSEEQLAYFRDDGGSVLQ